MTILRSNFVKKLVVFILLLGGIASTLWLYNSYVAKREGIYTYRPELDRGFILKVFKENWYWLVNSYDYSPEHTFDNLASDREPANKGNLKVKVYYSSSEPAGFVAYYQKPFYEGFVLFLAVDKKFRSRGFARKLLQYAIDDLKNRGSIVIRLITRVDNKAARKVYEGMGFQSIGTDGEFITYEKK